MALTQDNAKTANQKILVKNITDYITAMLGDNPIAKQYMQALGERDVQKALNKLGQKHADVKKAMEALPPDQHNAKEEEVVQGITQMLTAYNHSKKNEEVAIGIMSDMLKDAKSQSPAPSQQPKPEAAAKPAPAPKK